MSTPVIETTNLSKQYRDTMAVNDLSLHVERGEVFGFLGPNGAGKTTTILMLLGLTEPTGGRASVCGFNPARNPLEVKRRVGYLPENPGFYEDLSAAQNLSYIARLNQIDENIIPGRVKEGLEQVGLLNDANRLVREFSRGMKQRLGIADVLVKEPELIVLDEPTLGIDPDGVSRVLELITTLSRERNLTVLLCSHLLHQVQRICHRIGIIVKGKLVVQGTPDELGKAILKEQQWNFLVEIDGNREEIESDLRKIPGISECESRERGWFIRCTKDVRHDVLELIRERSMSLLQLRSEDPTLEEIYLKYFREA